MKQKMLLITFGLLIISFNSFSQRKIDLLILNKNYSKALAEIDNQLTKNPSAELYHKKGAIYSSLQNYQEAIKAYTKALETEPNNVDVLGEIAEDLAVLGNNDDAVKFYNKAIALSNNNLTLMGKLGRVYINQKEYQKAYNTFNSIYAVDSTNVFWNKQLAFCSFRILKRKQAVHLYEKVLEANPRDYGTYSNLIHAYNWRKESKKVSKLISKGLEQFPDDPGLLLEYANFNFKKKFYPSAMVGFENYFKVGGDSIQSIVLNYAISTYFSNDIDKALTILTPLFTSSPNNQFVMFYMGLCYKKLKDFNDAEKLMKWAIDASVPEYIADMYHHLGQIYGQQRKFNESIDALKNSYKYNPDNYEVLFEIATTYEEFNSNKTLALNYYRLYVKEAKEDDKNVNYAFDRITKIKEDLFFEE